MKAVVNLLMLVIYLLLLVSPIYSQDNTVQHIDHKVYLKLDTFPVFNEGKEELSEYISKNAIYPKQSIDKNDTGVVKAELIIEKNGCITIDSIFSLGKASPALVKEVIRIVKTMPKWMPGKKKGEVVRSKIYIYIKFSIKQNKTRKTTNIYVVYSNEASFVGGEAAYLLYLQESIIMPKFDRDTIGTVFIKCLIKKDGSIDSITVVKEFIDIFNKEAAEVVSRMPKWYPANVAGENIETWLYIPIKFTIQGSDCKKKEKRKNRKR